MNHSIIRIYKVIYCSITKKYKIIFHVFDSNKEFIVLLDNNYAKNIAMASENITSILLSQYELFINFLNEVDFKIDKITIQKYKESFNTMIQISSTKNDNSFVLSSYIGDAIILALKSFSDIHIENILLTEKNKSTTNFFIKQKGYKNYSQNIKLDDKSDDNKITILQSALNECLIRENYESAAFLRDRIKVLNKNKCK